LLRGREWSVPGRRIKVLFRPDMEKCSVKDACTTNCSAELISRAQITDADAELIRRRSGIGHLENICSSHWKELIVFFPLRQRKCCDPFKKHSKSVMKNLVEVTLPFANLSSCLLVAPLVPGMKLCKNCVSFVRTALSPAQIKN
jgi:hypothetical protein